MGAAGCYVGERSTWTQAFVLAPSESACLEISPVPAYSESTPTPDLSTQGPSSWLQAAGSSQALKRAGPSLLPVTSLEVDTVWGEWKMRFSGEVKPGPCIRQDLCRGPSPARFSGERRPGCGSRVSVLCDSSLERDSEATVLCKHSSQAGGKLCPCHILSVEGVSPRGHHCPQP